MKYEYTDSGIEWIGNVPKHWSKEKIFRASNFVSSGGTPQSGNELFYLEGDIPWIQSGDLNDSYITQTEKKITKEGLEKSSAKIFPKGTLLVAMYGASIGKIGIQEVEAATNQACCAIQPENKIETKFLYYLFLSIREKYISDAYGGGQPNISQSLIKQTYFFAPPKPEQTTIADYLDKACADIDRVVAMKRQQIEKIEEYEISEINRIANFGITGNHKRPSNWKTTRLKNVGINGFVNGIFKKKDEFGSGTKLINVSDLYSKNNIIQYKKLERVNCNEEEIKRFSAIKGDIFFVRSSLKLEGIGVSALLNEANEDKTVFECHIIRFRPNQKLVNPKFLKYVLNSKFLQNQFISFSKTVTMTTIAQNSIASIKISYPPLNEQLRIVEHLDKLYRDTKIIRNKIEKQIDTLLAYKKSLIHEVVTGKKHVYFSKQPEETLEST